MDDFRQKKISLLQEFNTSIAPQKLQLETLLPDLWRQCYAAPTTVAPAAPVAAAPVYQPAASAGKGSLKRLTSAASMQPDLKKFRSDEIANRAHAMFKECKDIVVKLTNLKAAQWFRKPVDVVALKIPNYHLFVKTPMDLGTIRSKLTTNQYSSVLEFRDDVELVWSNCFAYNKAGTEPHTHGQHCQSTWENLWRKSGLEERWRQLQFDEDPAGAPLHVRASMLSSQLTKAVQIMPTSQPADTSRSREMSFAEKRRLSQRLGQVQQPALLEIILEICSADAKVASSTAEEVEVEIDDLKPETLWKLQELVDRPHAFAAARAAGKLASTAPPNTAAPEKRPNVSVQSSGAGSEHSGEHSPHGEVKGSSIDGPDSSGFVRPSRDAGNNVDESATAPKEQSVFLKDRAAARKAEVNIDSANWSSLKTDEDAGPKDAEPEEGDDMWESFKSIAEQKQKKEEEQRLEAEKAERLKREELERQKKEEEERQQKLREEEERQQNEMQKQREEQMQKELAEIQAKAGTANLTTQGDVAILAASMPAPAATEGLAALGLEYHDDDAEMDFDD